MAVRHEFETTQGDELTLADLRGASWRVVETMLDLDGEGPTPVFTHRIEVHSVDAVAELGGDQ